MLVTAEQLKQKLEKKEDFVLLDVRTPEEYQNWHIEGSVHIPMHEVVANLDRIPKQKEVVALCAHGIRSARVAQFLAAQGFDAKSVEHGMVGWNAVYEVVPLIEKDFSLYQVKRLAKGCLGYFLVSGGKAAVIDPSTHTQEYLKIAKGFGCTITTILDTHQHADHISGARLLQEATKAEFYLNPKDGYSFSFREMKDRGLLSFDGVGIEVLHTPGHTPGSTSLLVGNVLLTGDTLFTTGVARPDLKDMAEEYAGILYETYKNILNLPDGTVVAAAHTKAELNFGQAVAQTLGWVRKNNRVFELSKSEFVKYVVANIPPKPFNYETIIKVNKGTLDLTEEEIADLEFGENRCGVNG